MPTTEGYNGAHTGAQIDAAISAVRQKESTWDGKASKPIYRTVTLASGGWSSNAQTVSVPGVLADETKQLIQPTPANANRTAWNDAGIQCTGQAANSLTFTCETVPSSNITVYVVIQDISAA